MTRTLIAVAVLLALSSVARAQSLEKTTVAIPAVSFSFTADYVAEDAGLYKQSGLDVEIKFLAGNAGFNAMVSGAVDFAFSSGTNLDRAAARGQRMLAIANMNNLPPWDVVLRKSTADAAHFDPAAPLAERVKVLKGRTIVVDGIGSAAHSFLRVLAMAGGVDPDSITVSALQPQEMLAAYQRGQIDGISLGPPWPQTLEQDAGVAVIASGINGDPAWLTPIGSSTVITRPQFCADHRSTCEKMGRALSAASRFVHERPDDAIAILQKRFPKTEPPVVAASFEVMRKAMPQPPALEAKALSNADRINVEAGFIKPGDQLKTYDDLFTNEYVK
ncbi:MAG TPA: ABC transporter substrate-binding protein [Stellaceae bacterium]|jgi:ABC-type nitrate/sulfonate/bicarbonate transport system substrate-binding protein